MEAAGQVQHQAHIHEANGHLHSLVSFPLTVPNDVLHHHTHSVLADQACSVMVQTVNAPVETPWSIVRRFDNPQSYKPFLNRCHIFAGDGRVGSIRVVGLVSGLPASTSTERLEILDDEKHVISFRIVDGDHQLHDYRSVTTLHATEDGNETLVVESYVVDVPKGNTKEETCYFVDNFIRYNLRSLAQVAESLYERSRA